MTSLPRRRGTAALAIVLAVAASALGACVAPPPAVETEVDSAAARISVLQSDLAEVADRQSTASSALDLSLSSIRAVDLVVPLLADEATLDEGLAAMRAVGPDLDVAQPAASRPVIREVAFAVDRARVSLRRAQDVLAEVPEDVAYLDATDVVLTEVRDLSAAEDALAQVVARHLVVYRDLRDAVLDFADRRGRFRSAAEATDALSVELRQHVRDLAIAQEDITVFVAERVAAASAVNAAQAEAGRAFRGRDEGDA